MKVARAAALVFALGLAACGSPGAAPIPVTASPWDTLSDAAAPEFARARAAWDAGDWHAARAAFEHLAQLEPENILLGIWMQEAELQAASADAGDPARAAPVLRGTAETFEQRADVEPSVTSLVLAARITEDPAQASARLQRALELDPDCAWVHYGLAFLAAAESDWPLARASIARAKSADPGHVWTYWLEAWILTRTGSTEEASNALQAWLDRVRDDPRVDPRLVAAAQLDLALLRTLDRKTDDARDLLEKLDARLVDDGRRLAALACVDQENGDVEAALAAAQSAARAHPKDVLPALQIALLYDEWVRDPARAEQAWKHVLELARGSSELLSALQRTRARVRLERFDAARASAVRDAR